MPNIYLQVSFKDKEQAKALGARWDGTMKKWYVPSGLDLKNFHPWLPEDALHENNYPPAQQINENGITLSQLLQKVSHAIQKIEPQLEWIKAEVSEVSLHAGTNNCYLELIEMHNNKLLCKAKAMISREDYPLLFDKFKQVTGDFLKSGMQILLLAKLNFSIQYGFNLFIKDLDPAYTIGDLAAKLAHIRDLLQKEGLYNKNKQLPLPSDFTKIAVLSPNAAAGLGDFQREASILESCGLCNFYYYAAQFQGTETTESITSVLNKIFLDHNEIEFDVMVIIRGGGAVIDLAWLNDYNIAKLICESPIPIYSGIGHERDNTIIDEVAGIRFDTPSKVIAHIFNIIVSNAQQATANAKEIKNIANTLYINKYNSMLEQLNKTLKLAQFSILDVNKNIAQQYFNILTNSKNDIKLIRNVMEQHYLRIFEYNILNLKHIDSNLAMCLESIMETFPRLHSATIRELKLLWSNITSTIHTKNSFKNETIDREFTELKERADIWHYQMQQTIKELIANILSLSPHATLNRGYTIIRNSLNKVMSSKKQADECKFMQIEFHDGTIKVTTHHTD